MKGCSLVIGILGAIVLGVATLMTIAGWLCHNHSVKTILQNRPMHYIRLSFKQFKSFYDVAPDKWTIDQDNDWPIYEHSWNKKVEVIFWFRDYCKYNNWARYREQNVARTKNETTLLEYMDYWKGDAVKFEQKARLEIEAARTKILKIQEELKKHGYSVDGSGVSDSEYPLPADAKYI